MVTGTLDLHIMDKQFLAKASFLKKKKKYHSEEHIAAYPGSWYRPFLTHILKLYKVLIYTIG